MHIRFEQFDGLTLHFAPTKGDVEFAVEVLKFIKLGSQDPTNVAVTEYFIKRLTREVGEIQ